MKNKKGGKGQKTIATLQQQQAQAGKNKDDKAKERARELEAQRKLQEQKRQAEMAELFKPVQVAQKVPFGVDPKTILCSYFKAGHCEKGNKCKFSHDPNIERKAEKKDLYTDVRDKDETMENWDEEKLREVVMSKHGNLKTTTDIVCKHFIDAIEEAKYGFFWQCPSGDDCKYRHALPPGFVLKSQRKKDEEDEKKQEISLEEFLEVERHKIKGELTPVTADSFAEWKKNRMNQKDAEADLIRKTKQATASAGRTTGMSGRDLFELSPLHYEDSDEEDDGEDFDLARYRRETEDERDRAEKARIEALGGSVASIHIT
ncbi:uncharacterized protein L969DRAFT_170404 [Mixia osmundae IAM 14324]|nr:uncharacterized protein L969DRAFT_170404 [Mixia osmundae IAM 14324]KEI42740.1 hypothetical protein L969DRAFT_170404 [Mixia osmundae IAM 14324]